MNSSVYTIGYAGRSQDEIVEILNNLDAVLLDIRFSPYSRTQEFTGRDLQLRLGNRYIHVKELGNVNYKNGELIQIANYPAGKAVIEAITKPVVLMCGCWNYTTCHRCTVARLLRLDHFMVQEIARKGE